MEKIFKKQEDNFLERKNLLTEKQHGFRERRSCVTNLLEFYERVSSDLEMREGWVYCIYLDILRESNTVSHRILIMQLNHL